MKINFTIIEFKTPKRNGNYALYFENKRVRDIASEILKLYYLTAIPKHWVDDAAYSDSMWMIFCRTQEDANKLSDILKNISFVEG